MVDPAIAQLMSVVAGGVLAVLGGLTSNLLIGSITRSHDQRKLLRTKLEDLCFSLWKDDSVLRDNYGCMIALYQGHSLSLPAVNEEYLAKIEVLIHAYFPSLLEPLCEYRKARDENADARSVTVKAAGNAKIDRRPFDPKALAPFQQTMNCAKETNRSNRSSHY